MPFNISKEKFLKYINLLQKHEERYHAIYDASNKTLDLAEYDDDLFQVCDLLADELFGSENAETIGWWLYDKSDKLIWMGETTIANIETAEDLYEYLLYGFNAKVCSKEAYEKALETSKVKNELN